MPTSTATYGLTINRILELARLGKLHPDYMCKVLQLKENLVVVLYRICNYIEGRGRNDHVVINWGAILTVGLELSAGGAIRIAESPWASHALFVLHHLRL